MDTWCSLNKGVLPLLAEDHQEASGQALALRWLRDSCAALKSLHINNLIHGDVSPRNLIVTGSELVLTDYDFVQKIGEQRRGPGTRLDRAPLSHPASPADDIFALAASFFHVLFDREPFLQADLQHKTKGLHWEGLLTEEYSGLTEFLKKATAPEPAQRFQSVDEAIRFLADIEKPSSEAYLGVTRVERDLLATLSEQPSHDGPVSPKSDAESEMSAMEPVPLITTSRSPQHVLWLKDVLQSYPGSRWETVKPGGWTACLRLRPT